MDLVPSQTLYVNNLNEKIDKKSLKKTLYMVFNQYGKVIEIVACKGLKLRGQAWIVYDNVASATAALRGKQGFNFYDKPLKIAFAKEKSDIIAKAEGTYTAREKRSRHETTTTTTNTSTLSYNERRGEDGNGYQHDNDTMGPPSKAPKLMTNTIPHRILFAQNLPESISDVELTSLFRPYPGFQEVRTVPGKKGIAFVEFLDQVQATVALQNLNGLKLSEDDDVLHLTYGKQ